MAKSQGVEVQGLRLWNQREKELVRKDSASNNPRPSACEKDFSWSCDFVGTENLRQSVDNSS
jgi:hypothetical protein